MNFLEKNKALFLVYPSMKPVTLSESVNVMLPPQFYTMKKEVLPIRYAFQAKRIAPSLFDGLLEEGKAYEYMVWKEGEAWIFLAYDLERITAFLERKGFALEQVSKLFFAQQVEERFDKPLWLGENEALVSLDHMAVVVPRAALAQDEGPALVFDDTFTPKKGVTLQGAYGSLISLKEASILAAVLTLFALMFFVEGWRYRNSVQSGEAQMQEMLADYPSLQSKYTRENIVAKYKTIDTAERKKRDIVKTVSGMIFKGVSLTALEIDEKRYSVLFSCKDAKVAKRLQALAQRNKLPSSPITGSHDLKIEGAL